MSSRELGELKESLIGVEFLQNVVNDRSSLKRPLPPLWAEVCIFLKWSFREVLINKNLKNIGLV